MAFADAFDVPLTIKCDIQYILGKIIPIKMVTNSLSLFDVLTIVSTTP